MLNPHEDAQISRWEKLTQEVQEPTVNLNGFTLVGVLDRGTSPIASMQEEIDQKAREALVACWLDENHGERLIDLN